MKFRSPRLQLRHLTPVLLALCVTLLGGQCPDYRSRVVASGFDAPVFLTAPPGDPRLFVVEQPGRIRVVAANGVVQSISAPFLDIVGRVQAGGEQGLLGLAFAPDYATSGIFYVYYVDLGGNLQLSRFLRSAGDPDLADPDSERLVLNIPHPSNSHNGGTIAFSPVDGMLYLGLGDGGFANDFLRTAQDPQSLLGKMLRLDVSGGPDAPYSIPPDNPFVGDDGVRDEIWASGLRNPYRFSFDRETGDLWIADVGQGLREELNFEPAGSPGGLNWGWPIHEGTVCYYPAAYPGSACEDPAAPTLYHFPVWEYDHSQGCAIIGGPAYRGSSLPFPGAPWLADLCSQRIWTRPPGSATVDMTPYVAPAGGFPDLIYGMGEDGFGEIYVTVASGTLHRIEYLPDEDGDGIPSASDNCPAHHNRTQADGDDDGSGDACDATP
jgi:hypothetical protein